MCVVHKNFWSTKGTIASHMVQKSIYTEINYFNVILNGVNSLTYGKKGMTNWFEWQHISKLTLINRIQAMQSLK